jgi:hypothetical protein
LEVILIGGNRQPGQQFKLYLVDLGPQDKQLFDDQGNPDWNSGFPASFVSGQGEQVLYSVTFTTDQMVTRPLCDMARLAKDPTAQDIPHRGMRASAVRVD